MQSFEEYWDKQYKNGKTPEGGHKEVAGKAWETALLASHQTEKAEASSLSDGLLPPNGLTKNDTLDDCLKRADRLATPKRYSGMMLDRKDLRRIVLMAYEIRKLQGLLNAPFLRGA